MLSRIVLAVIVGVVVTLLCVLVGGLLITMPVSWAAAVGAFLKEFSGLLGLLAALWYFFSGTTWPGPARLR